MYCLIPLSRSYFHMHYLRLCHHEFITGQILGRTYMHTWRQFAGTSPVSSGFSRAATVMNLRQGEDILR